MLTARFSVLATSAVVLSGTMLAGCQTNASNDVEPASTCVDDGPTFPGTTTCISRSVNFMDPDALAALPEAREGCEWAPQQVKTSASDALFFMAASCQGVTTTFSHKNGKVSYASGDLYVAGQTSVIEVFEAPEGDGLEALRAQIAALPETERKDCLIQPYDADGAPVGSVVIGPTPEARTSAPQNQPNSWCGDYGLDEDEASFWLVRGHKAMFFRLGQELQDIAPGTVTVMAEDQAGHWSAAADRRGELAQCRLEVEGRVYLDGVCELHTEEDSSFQIFGKDYFAYASILDDGMFNVSWNASPENTHAAALLGEDFTESGHCLIGAKPRLCRWELGSRPDNS